MFRSGKDKRRIEKLESEVAILKASVDYAADLVASFVEASDVGPIYVRYDGKTVTYDRTRAKVPSFSESEMRLLLNACHPDKHKGSTAYEELTKKLLTLRGETK